MRARVGNEYIIVLKINSYLFHLKMNKIYLITLIIILFNLALLEGKKDLFDEIQFKYLKMKNRVFKGALEDFESWENGKATEKYLKRYEELSKLEIGTIISGGILLEPNEAYPVPTIEKDEYIPELKKIVDIVHKNGGNIVAQLGVITDLDLSV
jgi:hypothetical protein